MKESIKVCFVALNAYPAIDPAVAGSFGGIETRAWLFARALAEHQDFEVSFVVRHWNPLRQKVYAGVQLHLLRDRYYAVRDSLRFRLQLTSRFPWLRLRQPKLSDLFYLPLLVGLKLLRPRRDACSSSAFLKKIDADLLLTFGVQSYSATVIATAQANQRPAVLFLGSDSDLDENYLPGSDYTSVYRDQGDVCYWTIQNASAILCQTDRQRDRLEQLFQRQGNVIRNPIDLESWDRLQTLDLPEELTGGWKRYALWVGRADAVHKRPQDLLEVARRCPEVSFLMVMNRRDDVFEAQIRAQAPENVRIVEHVPFAQMPALFSRAAVFVNTSALEGFPNTFLQAAASKVPIASLNVEDDFLKQSQSGVCAQGDLELLAQTVRQAWAGEELELRGREYIEEHHALKQQTELLAQTLKKIAKST